MSDGAPSTQDHREPLPEGEEQAPPGTRTMAMVRWGLVVLMAVTAVAAWTWHVRTTMPGAAVAGAQFICPMHPQIVTDRKGECPICGMDLVPAGAAKAGAAVGGPPGAAEFTCPMHPAFVTTDPKARCPDCGMKLVARAQAPAPPPGAAGVPGLAPVDLTSDRIQLIGMRTAPATRQPVGTSFRAVGFVTPSEAGLVSVTARFSGWVESLGAGQTGQQVRQGEVLASVYSPEMLNAQQVFLNAIKWSDRKIGNAPATPVSSDLERDARLRLELLGVAQEDIDAIAKAGTPQRAINVRAPVRGYVARKNVLRGLYVQSGSELFQLADLSTVWVLVDVYESEIARVSVGQKAVLELSAWPGERFTGTVQFVYPALNTGSRTLQARLEFRNPGLKLRPGMYGDVTLEGAGGDALVVPVDALIDTGEHQYVFVDRGGGRFEPRAVRTATARDGVVAILAGLAEGEKVVTTANFLLDSESRLRAAVEGFANTAAPSPAPPMAPGGEKQEHGELHEKHEGHEHGAAPMKMATPPPAPPKASASAGAEASKREYTCPMHPAFVTTDPKARCPDCGMKLVPRVKGAAAAPAMPMPMPEAAGSGPPAEPMPMPGHGEAMPMPAGPSGPDAPRAQAGQ